MEKVKCPHCGSESGYYNFTQIKGIGTFYYAEKRDPDEEMKPAYCRECHGEIDLRKSSEEQPNEA